MCGDGATSVLHGATVLFSRQVALSRCASPADERTSQDRCKRARRTQEHWNDGTVEHRNDGTEEH